MRNFDFVTVDTILSKINRDLGGVDFNEGDAIEWIAEAISEIRAYPATIQKVVPIEINNFQGDLPFDLHSLVQVIKYNGSLDNVIDCSDEKKEEENKDTNCEEYKKCCTTCPEVPLKIKEFIGSWVGANGQRNSHLFEPVKLTSHTYMSTLVNKKLEKTNIYTNCTHEYQISGNTKAKITTSFESGIVLFSYRGIPLDEKTGYPLIPDVTSVKKAITYYVKWMLAQRFMWNRKEGYSRLAADSEAHWLKYVKQSNNKLNMPNSIEEYLELMKASYNPFVEFNPDKNFYR